MLQLTRKLNEQIVIETPSGEVIVVEVCHMRRNQVRVGIDASRDAKIYRREIYDKIKESESTQDTKLDLVGS